MGRVSARMRRSTWRRPSLRALLSAVRSCSPVLLVACLLGIATAAAPAADTPPDPVGGAPAPPTAAPPPEPAMITPNQEVLNEIIVETTEPQFVAPTRRDRIGRIWAPVLIDGKGPYRLVLDTGANRSAITAHTAQLMGCCPPGTALRWSPGSPAPPACPPFTSITWRWASCCWVRPFCPFLAMYSAAPRACSASRD